MFNRSYNFSQIIFIIIICLIIYSFIFQKSKNINLLRCNESCIHNLIKDKHYFEKSVKENNVIATYGTVTPKGIHTLINKLNISSNDTFIDLGSGNGNITINFALNTPVKKSLGIEYYKDRYNDSIKSLSKLKQKFPQFYNKIKFINDNIYDYDINQSIVFSNSLLFTNELLDDIVIKLENNPNLKYYITNNIGSKETKLNKLFDISLNCSWSNDCIFSVYSNILK